MTTEQQAIALLDEIYSAGYIKTKHTGDATGLEERVAEFLAKADKPDAPKTAN